MKAHLIAVVAALGMAVSSAYANDGMEVTQVSVFKGHCLKAEIGGQDLAADCTGTVTTIHYASGAYGVSFPLSGRREVSFTSSSDPKARLSDTSWAASQGAFKTGSDERAYQAVSVVCDRHLDIRIPKRISCTGQADGQPVAFEFATDGKQD